MNQGRFPDFFIIGAPKAGSSALWQALRGHPDVYFPATKEPNYFAYKGRALGFTCPGSEYLRQTCVTDEATYLNLFRDCPAGSRAGEASVVYLGAPDAPDGLAAAVPHARLVAVVRHPVDRAFSHWSYFRQLGWEAIADFEAALAAAPSRLAAGWRRAWDYIEPGRYGKHLDRWLGHFDRSQLLVLFYEDWAARPHEVLGKVCRHIGVAPRDDLPVTRENPTHGLRWPALRRWMVSDSMPRRLSHSLLPVRVRDAISHAVDRANVGPKPQLDPAVRTKLLEIYVSDIDRLETITGRDLSAWRT